MKAVRVRHSCQGSDCSSCGPPWFSFTNRRSIAMKWLLSLLLLFGGVGSWAGPPPDHTVRPGENLSMIGKQYGYDWRVLCAFNGLTANCNSIQVDRKIRFPERRTSSASPKLTKEVPCITLGVAPFNPEHEHNQARTLLGIDLLSTLTARQKQLAKEKVLLGDKASEKELVGQQIFSEMLYASRATGKAEHVYGKPICTPEQGGQPEVMDTYDLGEGVFLSIPRRCGNPSVFVKPVPRREEVIQPEPEKEVLQPEPKEPPFIVTEPSQPKPKEEQRCIFDPKAVLGQEHEPTVDGNDSHSTYLSVALYCTKRDKDGVWGVGVGTQDSWWHGRVNFGAGRFHGQLLSFGSAIERIADKGWTFEGKILFGRIHEKFGEGEYASHRQIDFMGPSISYNNYERRERGERFLPETRLFAMAGWATNVQAEHSWQGKPIADTKELSQFGALFQAGVHQDVYDHKYATLWARAGYFSETPFSETANLRIGVSDPQRVCGIGVGFDFDLKHGGEAFGYGWWCDLVKGADVARSGYRLSQVSDGVTAAFENGAIMTPLPADD